MTIIPSLSFRVLLRHFLQVFGEKQRSKLDLRSLIVTFDGGLLLLRLFRLLSVCAYAQAEVPDPMRGINQ